MQSVDSLGEFWRPDSDGEPLVGRLVFDPEEGGSLELAGRFGGEDDGREDGPTFLHGLIDSGPVTIDNCFGTGGSFRSSGLHSSKLHVNSMFLGYHLSPE